MMHQIARFKDRFSAKPMIVMVAMLLSLGLAASIAACVNEEPVMPTATVIIADPTSVPATATMPAPTVKPEATATPRPTATAVPPEPVVVVVNTVQVVKTPTVQPEPTATATQTVQPDVPTSTATAAPIVATPVPPTVAPPPHTATPLPPTATLVPFTAMPLPPTSTPALPTATPIPPTTKPVPPTVAPVLPSIIPEPPTATPAAASQEIQKEVVVEAEVVREVEVATDHVPALASVPQSMPEGHGGGGSGKRGIAPIHPPRRDPGDTTFRDYPRNSLVSTSVENQSTFSLDTDRTSFQLALNWTRSGYELNPDSVRAEEWVNAFNYAYDAPKDDLSFNILTDMVAHPLDENLHIARVAFQAPEIDQDLPINVTLVLDASGSMADGNRVAIARAAAKSIHQSLGEGDRISIVHFTDHVIDRYTVSDASPYDRAVGRSISSLAPHGSTNVQAGLNLGVQLADRMRYRQPEALNYVILMSDGVANVDATDPFAILETTSDGDAENLLRLITIGVGISNYNDYLLEQLSQHGNGWYRYLSSPEEARSLFSPDNWLALSVPFADQTRAQITWNEELVSRWRIIGYENRVTANEDFAYAHKRFAEIPSGTATTVFYELELVDRPSIWSVDGPLGKVEVRWVTPNTGKANSQHQPIVPTPAHSDAGLHFGSIVALASDRFSGLNDPTYEDRHSIRRNLMTLDHMLDSIESPIRGTDDYNDFATVLKSMIEGIRPEREVGYSGYSR